MRGLFDRARLLAHGSLDIGDVLARFAAFHADDTLFEEPGGRRMSYGEAAALVDRMAVAIATDCAPGDRVVIATPNGYDQFLLSLAACRAGAVAVPVNPLMRETEVEHVIADSGATVVVRDPGAFVGDAEGTLAPRSRQEIAAIFYSSGTTGMPKGAVLTHRALTGQLGLMAALPSGLRRDELVASLPVAHIMGFSVLLSSMAAGVPVYFLPRFDAAAVLDAIERRRSTLFVGVPAMYRSLLAAGAEHRDLSSIRAWASGADVMPADLARRFQRMGALVTLPLVHTSLGDAAFFEGYGLVETAGAVAAKVSPPGIAMSIPVVGRILGVPLPGYRLRVIGPNGRQVGFGQIGELLVKGPGLLAGYHGDAAATAEVIDADGWLHTGDLARRELMGMVTFAGRAKDVIKSGGYSVYAVEVERVMGRHPGVVEAAAVGLPDERLGEVVAVAVRVRRPVSEDQLLAWAAERLAAYKRPRRIMILDEFPRTGTQKVAKPRLAELFEAGDVGQREDADEVSVSINNGKSL